MLLKYIFNVNFLYVCYMNVKNSLMKYLVLTGIFLFSAAVTAQHAMAPPLFEKEGDLVKATYYHDNGSIAQVGFYKNNKLHGVWSSYDPAGNRTATARYCEGKKTGKWFFWHDEKSCEVDYANNKIVGVTHWNNTNPIVVK